MTRYGGRQVLNGFMRHAIEVWMLYNMTRRDGAMPTMAWRKPLTRLRRS